MEILFIIGLIGVILTLIIVSFVLFQMQQKASERLQSQQKAWEQAQEGHQQQWRDQQEKQLARIEQKLKNQIELLYAEGQTRKTEDTEHVEKLARQYEATLNHNRIEQELAKLPRIEDMPLPSTQAEKQAIEDNQRLSSLNLRGFDLSGRDLSHRYLAHLDLSNAQLVKTNLFMADLSNTCLKEANLTDADLSAANLKNADLRKANLTGTNLLVTDLNHALLLGAKLYGVRNLTSDQLDTTVIDETTEFGPGIDITRPRLPLIRSSEDSVSQQLVIEEN